MAILLFILTWWPLVWHSASDQMQSIWCFNLVIITIVNIPPLPLDSAGNSFGPDIFPFRINLKNRAIIHNSKKAMAIWAISNCYWPFVSFLHSNRSLWFFCIENDRGIKRQNLSKTTKPHFVEPRWLFPEVHIYFDLLSSAIIRQYETKRLSLVMTCSRRFALTGDRLLCRDDICHLSIFCLGYGFAVYFPSLSICPLCLGLVELFTPVHLTIEKGHFPLLFRNH